MLGGIAIGLYAFFEVRREAPEQATPIVNPIECSSPTDSEGVKPSEAQQPVPTAPDQVVHYADTYNLGDEIGTITLPSLELSWPIFQGTEEAQLAIGVGHFIGSVLPGLNDNSILSGHRTSVFNRIGELQINDLILVQTEPGIFTYQVRGFEIVDRSDQTVIGPSPKAMLTLTTCYPFNSLTATTEAFIVEADLIRTVLIK